MATIIQTRKFDTASITKLNGDNYRVWKMRLESLFKTHKIMDIVDGTKVKPTDAVQLEKWEQGDNEALTTMLLSMSDIEVDSISGCKTSNEIWSKLGSIYQSVSGESKQALWQKFYGLTAGPDKSALKTMVEIQNYASQLRAMGVQIDDEMEVGRVMSSLLHEKYRHFREAWRSVETSKQTPALLLSRLKTLELEDEQVKVPEKKETETTETQKAFHAGKQRKPKKSKEEIEELKKKTKCHTCKKLGHWKSECPDKPKVKESCQKSSRAAYMSKGCGNLENEWINDSGADRHYCGRLDWFDEYQKYEVPKEVSIADNSFMSAVGVGQIKLKALINTQWTPIVLENVEYVPGGANLLSENILLANGLEIRKSREGGIVYFLNGKPDIQAEMKEGVQIMCFRPEISRAMTCVKQVTWHKRLAHINCDFLKKTADKGAVYGLESMKNGKFKCESCILAKQTKKSYKSSEKLDPYEIGECLHADLAYATTDSHRGNKYFLVVKDEGSSFRQVYCQQTKDESTENMKDAINFIMNQSGNTVKMIRCDNGTELVNQDFMHFLSEKGIQLGTNSPGSSESNGLVEREVRIERDAARAMLIESQIDENQKEKHWDDAIMTACYILNRTLSSKNKEQTPFEMIFKKKPTVHHIRVFGCKAFARVMTKQKKWDPKSLECILVGYNSSGKNYTLYVPSEKRYINQAKHVDFIENVSPRPLPAANILPFEKGEDITKDEDEAFLSLLNDDFEYMDEDNLIPMGDLKIKDQSWAEEVEEEEELEKQEEAEEPRKSKRNKKQFVPFQAGFKAMSAGNIPRPLSFQEATTCSDAEEWKEAMDSEIRSQHENGTWVLVKRPRDKKILKNRWIYTIKENPDGSLDKFKSRIVVKGFMQIEGVDFDETFAPVCRYDTVRIMLSQAAARGWDIQQIDIATAFLNSPLKEEVFMEQPKGYVIGENLVCKLLKGLYGLKQAPRAWYELMNAKLIKMGFESTESDPCLYKKKGDDDTFLVLFVDDSHIMGPNAAQNRRVVEELKEDFTVSTRPLTRFLGIEIQRDERGIFIHQRKYIEDTLKRFNMSECKTQDIPMQPGLQLLASKSADTNLPFRELIGSLLFLARCTRPDIAYPVHYLARFFSNFDRTHWEAAKKILQYLKGTKDLGILYASDDKEQILMGFVDADYGSDKNSRKSTTGCVFTFNGSPVMWTSKRQTCIALSSTESEYIALAHGGKEAVWLSRIYAECGTIPQEEGIHMRTDSQSAIKIARNPEHHDKTKHIDIRHHYIRWLIESKKVTLDFTPDQKQPADILTKSIAKENFVKKRCMMGMESLPQKVHKRKALSSIIVDPKRPSLCWSLFILFLSFLTMGGATDNHKIGTPLLWRKGTDPVIRGFNAVTMKISLLSPCDFLPLEDIDQAIAKVMTDQCEKAYELILLNNLERICPRGNQELKKKEKKAIFLAIGFVLIAALASAGIGMAGFAISKTYEIETRQDELKEALDELERKVFMENKELKVLQSEIEKLAYQMDILVNDFYFFKESVVELQYITSYLTSKFMEGKKIISDTGAVWKKGKLTGELFDFLNFTLPCNKECPIEYGIFHKCSMMEDRKEIILEFALPTVDQNLTRVEADPFTLMVKDGSKTCALKYNGPTLATISVEDDCVYETHNEKPKNNLELATLSNCKNSSSFKSVDQYFKVDRCRASVEGDEKEFIQVKFFDDEYYIYCAGSSYSIKKRQVECPMNVFTLPLSLTFTLNEVEYKGNILQVIYREREDPFLKNSVGFHLEPHLNWSNIAGDLHLLWNEEEKAIQDEAKDVKVFEFRKHDGWIWVWTPVSIVGIFLLITAVLVVRFFLRKKKKTLEKAPEEILLQDNGNSDTHHCIIIQ